MTSLAIAANGLRTSYGELGPNGDHTLVSPRRST